MFIYFNENKLAYHKGQLAPFFIAFIIILIIAALVTVNIGKVAKTKTYSTNAVDAGALAAGSTMASAFNYIAVSNSYMIVNYQYFFWMASISFLIAYITMIYAMIKTSMALGLACPSPCAAIAPTGLAIEAVELYIQTKVSLIVQVIGYWMTQFFFYKMIREIADQYYHSALDAGYSFSFSNSGIGPKLTEDQGDDFRDWMKASINNVPNAMIMVYDWVDGQDREHSVASQVIIDPPDTYRLTHTVMPFPLEVATLTTAMILAILARSELMTAAGILAVSCMCQLTYFACLACCSSLNPFCCACAAAAFACWMKTCAAAMVTLGLALKEEAASLALSVLAHAGIFENGTAISKSGGDAWPWLICWIDDVVHDRLVDVYQTQRHQGADLGMWDTQYPVTTSSSRVSFQGTGSIYTPNPHFDASIILTDFLGIHLPNLAGIDSSIKDVEGDIERTLREEEGEQNEE